MELTGVRLHVLAPDPILSAGIGGNLDLRWTARTPREGIVKSDIPAIYARRVIGLRLRDVQIDWSESIPDYFSDGLKVENFRDLIMEGFSGRQAQDTSGAAVALQNGAGVSIVNSRALPRTRVFLQLDDVQDRRTFVNYDLSGAARVIKPANQKFEIQIDAPIWNRRR